MTEAIALTIIKLFVAAYVGLLTTGILYYGHLRITEAKQIAASQITESNFNKQQFVKENRHIFGINEKECCDIKEIYTVSPQDMGF